MSNKISCVNMVFKNINSFYKDSVWANKAVLSDKFCQQDLSWNQLS